MDETIIKRIAKATKLNKDELKEFISYGRIGTIPKKKLLVTPNKIVDKAYFLKNGIIRHYVKNGANQFTKNFIQGPRFMLPSLTNFFLESPSQIYCESLTDLDVIEWNRNDLFLFANKHPKMYKFLLMAVVQAFHRKEAREIALVQQDAKERYLDFLNDYPNLINTIPLQHIASYLGVRPETLSRIRANLNS